MRRVLNMMRNIRNWPEYIAFKTFTSREKGFTFKCHNGLNIHVPKDLLHPFKESFFDETYFKGLPDGYSLIKNKELCVVDIGANVGSFSLFVLSRYPHARIFAYEPMPNNFALLEKYKNELNLDTLHIHNNAVSDSEGEISLYYNADNAFTTEASINAGTVSGKDECRVKTVTLESIINTYDVDRIDFLKVDCEGSEYPILYSLDDKIYENISVIAVETHKAPGEKENQGSLARYLKSMDFRIRTNKPGMIWAWKRPE